MRELFFKCIGAILVLYTGAAMGWRKGNAAMRRVQVLADICAFLGAVRDDLHFRCGRTEEILAAAQQNTRLSALPLYFSDLASGCGLQTELDNALCRTEREIAGVTRAGRARAAARRAGGAGRLSCAGGGTKAGLRPNTAGNRFGCCQSGGCPAAPAVPDAGPLAGRGCRAAAAVSQAAFRAARCM